MEYMKRFTDLFEYQLKDLYSAEGQLIDFLARIAPQVTDYGLRKLFSEHLEMIKGHHKNLLEIGDRLEISCSGETCPAMELFIREMEVLMRETSNDGLLEVGILERWQRIKHYKISGYSTASLYAKTLGLEAISQEFGLALEREISSDRTLHSMARERLGVNGSEEVSDH
tara:strand:+ start:12189 stop:12698 length:510 start_codon:yes stop_codon:yes gene_type:complete